MAPWAIQDSISEVLEDTGHGWGRSHFDSRPLLASELAVILGARSLESAGRSNRRHVEGDLGSSADNIV